MMIDRWNVGLTGGREVWVTANEVQVDAGYLVLARRGRQGSTVALALAPGEWTTLTPDPPAVDSEPPIEIDRVSVARDAREPRTPIVVASAWRDRRAAPDRRRLQIPTGPATAWQGINRRSGLERRAS